MISHIGGGDVSQKVTKSDLGISSQFFGEKRNLTVLHKDPRGPGAKLAVYGKLPLYRFLFVDSVRCYPKRTSPQSMDFF